jgi:hypothetical protein
MIFSSVETISKDLITPKNRSKNYLKNIIEDS